MIDVRTSLMEALQGKDLHLMSERIGISASQLQNYRSKKHKSCPSAFNYFIIMEDCGYNCTVEKAND